MKRKIISMSILFSLILTLTLILTNSNLVMKTIHYGINIWFKNVLPAIFPVFVLSELLIHYGFLDLFGELTKNITKKLFNLPKEASFVILGSMLSGFPSSGKYTRHLLDNNMITSEEATYLLTFTHFSNPLFILGPVTNNILKNKKIGIIILISHILTNFIIALFLRPKSSGQQYEKMSLKKTIQNISNKTNTSKETFSIILSKSIINSINTLLIILGIIITYLILITLLTNTLNLNKNIDAVLTGLLEMTSGISKISNLNYNIKIKASIITAFISFGGLSIHTQIKSIINDADIKFKYFFTSRIIHMAISSSVVFLILSLMPA